MWRSGLSTWFSCWSHWNKLLCWERKGKVNKIRIVTGNHSAFQSLVQLVGFFKLGILFSVEELFYSLCEITGDPVQVKIYKILTPNKSYQAKSRVSPWLFWWLHFSHITASYVMQFIGFPKAVLCRLREGGAPLWRGQYGRRWLWCGKDLKERLQL